MDVDGAGCGTGGEVGPTGSAVSYEKPKKWVGNTASERSVVMIAEVRTCSKCRAPVYILRCPKCGRDVPSVLHTPRDTEGSCIMCLSYELEAERKSKHC